MNNKEEINIGLIGFGTIGAGVVEIFNENREMISEKVGKEVYLKRVTDLDLTTDRGVKIEPGVLTDDTDSLLEDKDIDIVIELIGGYEPAKTFIKKAFENGKHVVSANKALIAKHWNELHDLAEKHDKRFCFEASVGGGMPILLPLNECLSANNFSSIYGIMNGTANYILTKMSLEGLEFEEVLKEAQEKGYAEADPSFDIEGHDTAQKLIILVKLGFGEYVSQEKFTVEGITKISPIDLKFAEEKLNQTVKLLGIAKNIDGTLEVSVSPTLIPKENLLASVNDVFNAINLVGDSVGPVVVYGQGAGRMPTASAIIGDCIDIISNPDKRLLYGPSKSLTNKIKSKGDLKNKYYLRVANADLLDKVVKLLIKNKISIDLTDKDLENSFIVTNETSEANMQNAIQEILSSFELNENELNYIRILKE